MDTIRVRRLGYPVRKSFEDVGRTYACLSADKPRALLKLATPEGAKEVACEVMSKALGMDSSDKWQCGTDRVFMRNGVVELLDAALSVRGEGDGTRCCEVEQTSCGWLMIAGGWMNGWVAGFMFFQRRLASVAVVIQANVKGMIQRKEYKKTRTSIMLIQVRCAALFPHTAGDVTPHPPLRPGREHGVLLMMFCRASSG